MIIFKRLTMRNFLSVGDNPITIELNSNPTTLINGNNGVGKTQICDGLTFALYGKSFRDIKKNLLINSINQRDSVVSIEFSKGNKEYKIIRGQKPNIFDIFVDGVKLDNDASVLDSQSLVTNSILGFDYSAFCRICIMSTMNYVPFMSLSKNERRNFVETMLELQIFGDMNKVHKSNLSALKLEIKDLQHEIENNKIKITEKENLLTYIKSLNDDAKDKLEKRLEELKSSKETIETSMKGRECELSEWNNLKVEFESKIKNLNSLVNSQKQDVTLLESKIKDNKNTIAYLTNNMTCDKCHQTITKENKQDIIEPIKSDLNVQESEYRTLSDKFKSNVKTQKLLNDKLEKINDRINYAQISLATFNNNIKSINQNIKKVNDEIYLISNKSDAKQNSMTQQAEDDIKSIKSDNANLIKECNDKLDLLDTYNIISKLLKDDGVKNKIIKRYIPLLCNHVNYYLSKLNISLTFYMDENFNESIKTRFTNEYNYNNLSAGERARVDLAIAFAWRQIASVKGSAYTNLLILDEVLDANLDESGTNAALAIVNELSTSNNIFIVSHKANLEEYVSSVLELEKRNGFTKIKVT